MVWKSAPVRSQVDNRTSVETGSVEVCMAKVRCLGCTATHPSHPEVCAARDAVDDGDLLECCAREDRSTQATRLEYDPGELAVLKDHAGQVAVDESHVLADQSGESPPHQLGIRPHRLADLHVEHGVAGRGVGVGPDAFPHVTRRENRCGGFEVPGQIGRDGKR